MSASSLTIGMATYRDPAGVYFTLQTLQAFHPRVEYLVIDNAPEPCRRTRGVTYAVGGKYLHRPDLNGTSAPRDALFRMARTDWVMCIDSHVILNQGAVQALLDYIKAHSNSKDLIQGPLIHDDGRGLSTHWRSTEPPGLWGVWDTAWLTSQNQPFTLQWNTQTGFSYHALDGSRLEPAALSLPDPRSVPQSDIEVWLLRHRCVRGSRGREAFPIPMQGLGLFAMRREAWPGFNRAFRGFGGEEGYIHEKVRQCGGQCFCLPKLGWRHWFRDMENGSPPPPYKLDVADHVNNLLIGHRELGIEATDVIRRVFAPGMDAATFEGLVKAAEQAQPFGQLQKRKRLNLLGVWYSNNEAPEKLLQASLLTIRQAVDQTMHHNVHVATCAWHSVPNNPFSCILHKPKAAGHAAIIEQIHKCIDLKPKMAFDGIVFLEHDVLYPPGYFDRMGDALATGAPVVSNLDYEGVNATGWLQVKERHEPMHQLAIRWDVAMENLQRAEIDCQRQGWALLEPNSAGDRSHWIRLQPTGLTPAIHVNHPKRFTSHGEVCYEASSNGRLIHPFWGDYRHWWPLDATPAKAAGCGVCNGQPAQPVSMPPSLEDWFKQAAEQPSDFHEHMQTLRELAEGSEVAVELSAWFKPALIALAAAKPQKLISVCPGSKPHWQILPKLLGEQKELVTIQGDPSKVEPVPHDVIFFDTQHRADVLYSEMDRWAPLCRKYMVVHTTVTFGEQGDDGGPGVLPAIRRYLKEHPEWTVRFHNRNNHGLICLTRLPEQKKQLPPLWKQGWNVLKASWKAGENVTKEYGSLTGTPEQEKRLELCMLCESRNEERCGECGCPLDKKTSWPTEVCPIGKWHQEEQQ